MQALVPKHCFSRDGTLFFGPFCRRKQALGHKPVQALGPNTRANKSKTGTTNTCETRTASTDANYIADTDTSATTSTSSALLSYTESHGGGWKDIRTDAFTGREDDCVRVGGRKRSAVEYRREDDERRLDESQQPGEVALVLSQRGPSGSFDGTILIRKADNGRVKHDRPTVILGSLFQPSLSIYILTLTSSHWQVIHRRRLIIYGQRQAQTSVTFSHAFQVNACVHITSVNGSPIPAHLSLECVHSAGGVRWKSIFFFCLTRRCFSSCSFVSSPAHSRCIDITKSPYPQQQSHVLALTDLAFVETKAWWPVAFGIWVSAACGSGSTWSCDPVFWADDSKFHVLLYYRLLVTIDVTTGCTLTTFGQIRAV